jgi:hypothetical protein
VYYVNDGKKKVETIVPNVPRKLAYALKNGKYKNHPDYRMGEIKVEPVNEKSEGMIKGYTDPNKDNLNYNWDAIPKRDTKKIEGPNMNSIKEIGIGDKNPVLKFKDWDGKYWDKKKKKNRKSNS